MRVFFAANKILSLISCCIEIQFVFLIRFPASFRNTYDYLCHNLRSARYYFSLPSHFRAAFPFTSRFGLSGPCSSSITRNHISWIGFGQSDFSLERILPVPLCFKILFLTTSNGYAQVISQTDLSVLSCSATPTAKAPHPHPYYGVPASGVF